MNENGLASVEFSPAEFAERLDLPSGSTVVSAGMIWFDMLSGKGSNSVRVSYRLPAPQVVHLKRAPLEDRLRRLAAKWRSQARHPQRQHDTTEKALLDKHADELMTEVTKGA